jgi:Zn-dependent peptidase ImmA (M78 family)
MSVYKPSELENWISTLYIRKGVLLPGDLSRDNIGKAFGFDYYIERSPAYCVEEEKPQYIVVDKRKSSEKQREQYFHELCHLLRHIPVPSLPQSFRELQEWEANNFIKYAAIPYHMLYLIDFNDINASYIMSDIFKVTVDLCKERLERIKNQQLVREMIR